MTQNLLSPFGFQPEIFQYAIRSQDAGNGAEAYPLPGMRGAARKVEPFELRRAMRHSSRAHESSCHDRIHAVAIEIEAASPLHRRLRGQDASLTPLGFPPVFGEDFLQILLLPLSSASRSFGVSHGRKQACGIPAAGPL